MKTRTLRFFAAGALILSLAPSAIAAVGFGQTLGQTVAYVVVDNAASAARIQMNGPAPVNRPTCHIAGYPNDFGVALGTTKGDAAMALFLAANLAGKRVNVTGTGACIAVGASTRLIEQINVVTILAN